MRLIKNSLHTLAKETKIDAWMVYACCIVRLNYSDLFGEGGGGQSGSVNVISNLMVPVHCIEMMKVLFLYM